jgi:hypothetical protein
VDAAGLSPMQLLPLQQRLDTLESFMPYGQTISPEPQRKKAKGAAAAATGNDWTLKVCHPKTQIALAWLTSEAGLSHNRRSIMPVYYPRRSLCTVQYLFEPVS